MTWTNEQIKAARYAMPFTDHAAMLHDKEIAAIMDSARDALAANGGTMTAEVLTEAVEEIAKGCRFIPDLDGQCAFSEYVEEVRAHLATQGAKVAELTGWLADLTEVLLGERPVGVMPSTTLDAAKALKTRVSAREADRERLTEALNHRERRWASVSSEASALRERVTALEADAEALQATIRLDREHDALLLAELGGSGETLRGAILRVKRERDEALTDNIECRRLLSRRVEAVRLDNANAEIGRLRAELAATEAERARLAEDAGVTQAMALRRELADARAELAKYHEAAPHDQETVDQLRAELARLVPERDAERQQRLLAEDAIAREKTNTEHWRQRCEKAANALADFAPGELGRLDLVGRINALKADGAAAMEALKQEVEHRRALEGTAEEHKTALRRLDALLCFRTRWRAGDGGVVDPSGIDEAFATFRTLLGWDDVEVVDPEPLATQGPPSGQVAEDEWFLRHGFATPHDPPDGCRPCERHAALSRLAADAQRTQEAERKAVMHWQTVCERGRALDAAESQLRAIRERATKASAELRHAFRPETRDWNLVARAIRILEEATTPNAPTPTVSPETVAVARNALGMPPKAPCVVREEGVPNPCEDGTCTHEEAEAKAGQDLMARSFDDGAEAMRAACLKNMRVVFGRHGLLLSGLWEQAKAAIEGAAP